MRRAPFTQPPRIAPDDPSAGHRALVTCPQPDGLSGRDAVRCLMLAVRPPLRRDRRGSCALAGNRAPARRPALRLTRCLSSAARIDPMSSTPSCGERRRSAAGASNASAGPLKRLVRRAPSRGRGPRCCPRASRLQRDLDGHEVVRRIQVVFTGFVDHANGTELGGFPIVDNSVNFLKK